MSEETKKNAEHTKTNIEHAEKYLKEAQKYSQGTGDGGLIKRITHITKEVTETREDLSKKLSPQGGG